MQAFSTDIFLILAKTFTSYSSDPEERARFGERVVEQYVSGRYHMSQKMYSTPLDFWSITSITPAAR
jgi:hypothetical protein